MEGAYNKIVSSRADVPADSYNFFMNKLMNTVRDEIAGCIEKAHSSLSISDAQKCLMFPSTESLIEYSKERKWELNNGRIIFKVEQKIQPEIPSNKTIYQTLMYAKELERIV